VKLQDRTIICHLCGEEFVYSAGEQELMLVRGLDKVPTRCSVCRRRPPTLPFIPKVTQR
jgi:hypothetical protein